MQISIGVSAKTNVSKSNSVLAKMKTNRDVIPNIEWVI